MKTVERIAFLRQAIYKKYSAEVLRELGNESDSTDRWKRLADKAISRSAVFQTYIECRDNVADFAEWQNEELTEERIQQERQ